MYKIRLKNYKQLGPLSKEEVLKRIASGKLDGSEKVSKEPYEKWEKLASYPDFYDAFVARIFHKEYKKGNDKKPVPDSEAKTVQKEVKKEGTQLEENKTTNQATIPKTHLNDDFNGKTQQIEPGSSGDHPVIEDSEVQKLFDSDTEYSQSVESSIVKSSANDSDDGPLGLDSPLDKDLSTLEKEEEDLDPVDTKTSPKKQKRQIDIKKIAAIALIVLGLVYVMGDDPKEEKKSTSNQLKKSEPALFSGSTVNKEERIRILIRDGNQFLRADMVASHKYLLHNLKPHLDYFGESTKVLGTYVEAGANYLPYAPNAESLKKEILGVIQQGRRLDPHSSAFYRAEAVLEMGREQFERAEDLIKKAVTSDPGNARNVLLLGEYNYLTRKLALAKESLEEALKMDRELVRAHFLLGKVAIELNNLPEAEKQFQAAASLNPLHPESYFLLGELLRERNQLKAASRYYKSASNLVMFTSRSMAAEIFWRLGSLREILGGAGSEQAYSLAYYFSDNPPEELEAKLKGVDLSGDWLNSVAKQQVYGIEFFIQRGKAFFLEKNYDQAASYFQAANILDLKGGVSTFRLAEALENLAVSYEDFNKVVVLYERTIQESPRLYLAYVRLGQLETERYNLDRSYKLLAQAEKLAPKKYRVHLALGKHFYARKNYVESKTYFGKAEILKPNLSETLYYTGLLLLKAKRSLLKDAEVYFYNAYLADPDNYKALKEWGKAKVGLFERNVAVKFVQNLIKKDSKNASLFWVLGEIYAAHKEHSRAIVEFHRALDRNNRDSDIRMSLANSLVQIGQIKKAIAEYRLASLLDRRNVEGMYKAAELLTVNKRYDDALAILLDLVRITPKYPGANFGLARIYRFFNEEQKAIDAMKAEVENNPQNPKFRIELAQLYMEYRQIEEAIDSLSVVANLPDAKTAPEFAQDKVRAYLLLSRCYRSLENFASAEGAIRLALQFDPNDKVLHLELGRVYLGLHRDKEAALAFREYLKRDPAGTESANVRKWLKKIEVPE